VTKVHYEIYEVLVVLERAHSLNHSINQNTTQHHMSQVAETRRSVHIHFSTATML